jgi:hypothetical protein
MSATSAPAAGLPSCLTSTSKVAFSPGSTSTFVGQVFISRRALSTSTRRSTVSAVCSGSGTALPFSRCRRFPPAIDDHEHVLDEGRFDRDLHDRRRLGQLQALLGDHSLARERHHRRRRQHGRSNVEPGDLARSVRRLVGTMERSAVLSLVAYHGTRSCAAFLRPRASAIVAIAEYAVLSSMRLNGAGDRLGGVASLQTFVSSTLRRFGGAPIRARLRQ